jgi:hypothetical protein
VTALSTPLNFDDPFTLFLFVAATIMMAGYAVGRWTNRRWAQQISNWLEPGLRSLGGTPTVQRLQRSAFRIQVTDARQPFRTVTVSVVLISREVLPTWLWERLKRHGDLLVVHVTFRQPPTLEGDIVDPGNELGRLGESQAQEHHWTAVEFPPRLRLYPAPGTSVRRLEEIADRIRAGPFTIWRLALRRNAPHMLLNMALPGIERIPSKQLVDMLIKVSKLAHSASGERDS